MIGLLIIVAIAAFAGGWLARDVIGVKYASDLDLTRQAARGELPRLRDRGER